jgi:hypothetical protein
MAVEYSTGKIVTSGLVLSLDAADRNSYPGSGTSWFDMSGNGNTGGMFGTVPFETDGGGSFNFATVTGTGGAPANNASLGFTFNSNMVPTLGSFTFSVWIKNPPEIVSQRTIFSNAGSGDGFRWGIGRNGIYVLIGPTYSEPTLFWSSTLSDTLWYNVTTIFDRSGTNSGGTPQWQSYLNGTFVTSFNMQSSQTTFTSFTPGIVRNACCDLWTGKLSSFNVYNRALSAAEILQNYNAQKSRFGL